ncbi:MAG TPA: hypothetical protein VHM00_08780 [Caldimonas sp.]|jgi:hypothetical protein|nr:hypothetical protein [Caldimonas sp.]HEX2541163.1 hypothetical protein [Caldimonas sp.]
MGLLDALKLPQPRRDAAGAAPKASGASIANGKTARRDPIPQQKMAGHLPAVTARLDSAWSEAVRLQARLHDEASKRTLAAAMGAVQDKRREAGKVQGDAAAQVVLLGKALIELDKARAAVAASGPTAPAPMSSKTDIAAADRKHQAAYAAHETLLAQQARLEKEIAAAGGSRRKEELEEAKAELDAKVEAAAQRQKIAWDDLQVLADPLAKEDARKRALVRSGQVGDLAETTELDLHPDGAKPGEKKITTTKSKVAGGVARIEKTTDTAALGPDGLTVGRAREEERTTAGGTLKQGRATKLNVSTQGLAGERTKTSQFEGSDGRKLSVEKKTAVEVGPNAATLSNTKTVERRDGSSTSTTVSGGVERGDGKAVVSRGASYTATDAGGTGTTYSAGAKQGILAGDKGTGAMAERSGGVARSRKSGAQSNARLTFGGVVTCQIKEPDARGLHPVVVHADFTAGIALGIGYDKKSDPKAKSKGGVSASVKRSASMEYVKHLPEAELDAYVRALEKSAKGDAAAATDKELAILAAGARQGWSIAQAMWDGRSVDETLGATEGDSATFADELEGSVGAKGNFKAIKGEVDTRRGRKSSTRLTRTQGGGLEVETNREDSEGSSGGLGVDTGLTGMMVRGGVEMKTSVGFLVTIEKADDPKGELLARFRACRTAAEQQAFIDANKGRIKLRQTTTGSESGSSSGTEFNVGPADLSLGSKGKVGRTRKTGGDGRLIDSAVVGSQEVGGSAGIGEFLRASDSRTDTATSRRDGQGNVSLDMQRERKSSNLLAKVKGALGIGDDEEQDEKAAGALEQIAGKETPDTDEKTVHGMRLGKEDIRRIVDKAADARAWSDLSWGIGDQKAILQWSALGRDIARVGKSDPAWVADELAAFVGADKGRRMDVLIRLARPGGSVSIGRRSEFPKSLKAHAKAYDELVLAGCAGAVEEKAAADGPAAATAWGQQQFQRLEKMLLDVRQAEDFSQNASQIEMMAAINERKQELLATMRKVSGATSAKDEDDATRHDYQRLAFELQKYPEVAERVLARLRESLGSSKRFYNDNLKLGIDGVTELADIYALWQRQFDKLAAAAKKLGKADADYVKLKPDVAEYKRMRVACGL